jgi:hypothetical protein
LNIGSVTAVKTCDAAAPAGNDPESPVLSGAFFLSLPETELSREDERLVEGLTRGEGRPTSELAAANSNTSLLRSSKVGAKLDPLDTMILECSGSASFNRLNAIAVRIPTDRSDSISDSSDQLLIPKDTPTFWNNITIS